MRQAIGLIDWYRARWKIEIPLTILKNGCQAEALQLGTFERLERALALFLVVAWRGGSFDVAEANLRRSERPSALRSR